MRIVTICGMGLGTSLLLKMTIEKALKEKGISADVEASDIGVASSAQADLIFTNQEFAKQIQHPTAKVIAVQNITSHQEIMELLDEFAN